MVQSDDSLSASPVHSRINRSADFILQAEIVETGVAQGKGKTFGIYDVSVVKCYQSIGEQENWHVFRRYSDFYELHKKVTSSVRIVYLSFFCPSAKVKVMLYSLICRNKAT